MTHYKLEGKEAVKCASLKEWAEWFEKSNRRVATVIKDGVRVSTVFLGLDHRYGEGPPQLFETMIFGGEHDEFQERYETWQIHSNLFYEVVALHKRALSTHDNRSH